MKLCRLTIHTPWSAQGCRALPCKCAHHPLASQSGPTPSFINVKRNCEGSITTHTPWSAQGCRALPCECAHHPLASQSGPTPLSILSATVLVHCKPTRTHPMISPRTTCTALQRAHHCQLPHPGQHHHQHHAQQQSSSMTSRHSGQLHCRWQVISTK